MYSTEIRENLKHEEEGWGRLKAKARVNNITWDTAIWFDSKEKTYLLPIKAAIRKTGKIVSGESLEVDIWI